MSRKRKYLYKKKKKISFRRRIFKYIFILFLTTLFLLFGFICSVYWGIWGKLPTYKELSNIRNYEASELYSEDGVLMGKYYIENRTNLLFNSIPQHTINALIATEDVRFYAHNGFDRVSMLRVIFKTLLLGNKSSGGGSTISQQLAKNLFPREEQQVTLMPIIKIKEIITAHRLEKLYNKNEILTLYLNTVFFGERTFGIESAAQRYFSVSASELLLEQSSTLIGMLKGPSRYNPRVYPERALNRRNTVISQMVKYKFLTEKEGEDIKNKALNTKYQSIDYYSGPAPYLRERIRQEAGVLIEQYNAKNQTFYDLYKDGLIITSTIDAELQQYAEDVVNTHMKQLQHQFYTHWGNNEPWKNNKSILDRAIQNSPLYLRLKKENWTEEMILEEMNRKKKMTVFDSYHGEIDVEYSSVDSIKHYLKILHPGVIAVEPQTGKVKAWVGGLNFKYFQYDQVTAPRQAGSVFKPIIYSAAIHYGIPLNTYYKNEQKTYKKYKNWTPRNSDNNYSGYYTMRGALSQSINTIAVDVLLQTGIEKTIVHAHNLGIDSQLPQYPSLALGTANIPLSEMIKPYLAYAGGGKLNTPYYILNIKDRDGNILYQASPQIPEQVISQNEANIMSNFLTDAINAGTGKRLRNNYMLKNDLAGKTGTTQNHADGWFIGYNPQLVVGIRVGANDINIHFNSIKLGQGANMALPIFGMFMQKCLQNPKYAYWSELNFPLVADFNLQEQNFVESLEHLSSQTPGEPQTLKKITVPQQKEEEKKGLFKKIGNIFKKKR